MQTTSPHPAADAAPRLLNPNPQILNLSALWQPTIIPPESAPSLTLPPLQALLTAVRLGELCEFVFPEQPDLLDEVIDWSDVDAGVAAIECFLHRVNALFPVREDIWDASLEFAESFLYGIPVIPMGLDIWYDGWCEMLEPAPYLLHMTWSRDGMKGMYRSDDEFDELYPDYPVPEFLEPQRLVDELRQILTEREERYLLPASLLAALPDFILMLNGTTGNVWLDVGESALAESGGYPNWSHENIEWLTESWEEAEPVLDSVIALMKWGESSQKGRAEKITAVRALLIEAYERSADEPTDLSPAPTA